MKGQRLQVVNKFIYLGSTLSRVVHIDDEISARIAKASAAFGRLRGSIWDRSGIRPDTKMKVYRSVVLPTPLYACETWTVYQRHVKRLNHFDTSCLCKLLKIKWQDRIPGTEVLKRARMQSVHTLTKLAQLRWTGHVTRMPDERFPKIILCGELHVGNAHMVARRSGTRRGAGEYEAKGTSEAEQKRAQRKTRAKASPTAFSSSNLSCSIYNRQFRAKIDLISHLRTHKQQHFTYLIRIDHCQLRQTNLFVAALFLTQ